MKSKAFEFLEEIKNEYNWFLYSYDHEKNEENGSKPINYPACCLLSAQLISSFLYVHFSKDVSCIYDEISLGNGKKGYGHAWSTVDGEIVDFTHFQFNENAKSLRNNIRVSRKQFDDIINKVEIFYAKNDHKYAGYDNCGIDNYQEKELLAIDYAKKYKPTKEGFMQYLSEAICIAEKISYP